MVEPGGAGAKRRGYLHDWYSHLHEHCRVAARHVGPTTFKACADLGTANHDDSERQVFVMPRPVRCNGDSCCVQHLSTYNRQDALTSLAQSIYACAPWVVC